MKTTLYFTRHGQTKWNLQKKMQGHKDSPLTEFGIRQAEWLRERLGNVDFDAIYSSSSPRAVSTARILLGNRPIDISTLDSLKEINMGLWEGQNVKHIQQAYPVQYEQFFNQPHLYTPTGHGESYRELLGRTLPAIKDIITKHKGKEVLIVTHRITLKAVMGYFLNKQLDEMGNLPDIYPTALCKITMNEDTPEVDLYGDVSHYLS